MESIYTFKFNEMQWTDLLRLFTLLSDKIGMEILGFDRKLIKIAGQHIVDSLLYIINGSLLYTIFPDEWKLARATPVFKNNGDVDVMSDYHHRSISVIGHKAKMVEQLVRSQFVRYLEEHYFITPGQSAYLKGHSTQTSLHRVIDDWLDNIDEDQITGVCLLDIFKCFDTINYSILLQKLSMHGIKHLNWNGFLPVSIIESKLCSVTMNFRVLLMLHVAYHRGLFLDHFYSYCSLMIYHNSQRMGA